MSDFDTPQVGERSRSLSGDESPPITSSVSSYGHNEGIATMQSDIENSEDEERDEEEEINEQEQVNEEQQRIINTVCPGSIKNERDFHAAKSRRLANLRREGGPVSPDFPSTNAAKQEMVKNLFRVIKDTKCNDIIDRRVRTGKLTRGVRMLESGIFDDDYIEMKCWELMLAAGDASRGIRLNDPRHSKESKFEVYPTFLARWDEIKDVLRVSKATCENILRSEEFLYRLASSPKAVLKTKKSNLVINNKRDVENFAGRIAMRAGAVDPADLRDRRPAVGEPTVGSPRRTNYAFGRTKAKSAPKTPAHRNSKSAVATGSKSSGKRKTAIQLSSQDDGGEGSDDASYTPSKKKSATGQKPRRGSTLKTASTADDSDGQDHDKYLPTRSRVIRPQSVSRINAPAALVSSQTMSENSQGFLQDGPQTMDQEVPTYAPQFMSQGVPHQLMQPISQGHSHNDIQYINASPNMYLDAGYGDFATQQAVQEASLEDYYKKIICDLLGLSHEFAMIYRLDMLRTYARAYSESYRDVEWRSSFFHGLIAVGPMLRREDGSIMHISHYNHIFMDLARARGDLSQERLQGQEQPLYVHPGSEEEQQALGITQNPFGLL